MLLGMCVDVGALHSVTIPEYVGATEAVHTA